MLAFGLGCRFRAPCGARKGMGFQLCPYFLCAPSDAVLNGTHWALIEMLKARARGLWPTTVGTESRQAVALVATSGATGHGDTSEGGRAMRSSEHTCLTNSSQYHSEQRPVTVATRSLMGKTHTCPLK